MTVTFQAKRIARQRAAILSASQRLGGETFQAAQRQFARDKKGPVLRIKSSDPEIARISEEIYQGQMLLATLTNLAKNR